MTFREQIEQKLQKLNKDQQREFAWRCAVRALPFLGSQGNFNFWKETDCQKHLLSIFSALNTYKYTSAYITFDAVRNPAVAANTNSTSFDSESPPFASAAVATVFIHPKYFANVDSIARNAASAAAGAIVNAASRVNINLKPIILEDLKALQNRTQSSISIASYKTVWGNFQTALRNEGCEYWADWYQELFENNFEFDKEEVETRVNLPEEIRNQGAAVVGAYMEKLKEEGGRSRTIE